MAAQSDTDCTTMHSANRPIQPLFSGVTQLGSYFKLLKSYYGNNLNSKAQSLVSSSVSTSKDSAKTLASIESEAEDMVKSAQALYKNSGKKKFS